MTKQEGAISGRIADRSVADLFQWLHETRGTAQARFRTALGTASVWFRDGEIIEADMGRFRSDAAVLRLTRIRDGEYEVEWKPTNQRRSVKAGTAQLLAEARQRAPRPGPAQPTSGPMRAATVEGTRSPTASAGAKAGSGEYHHARDEAPRVDTGAHTLIDAKAVPRPPGRAAPRPAAQAAPPPSGRSAARVAPVEPETTGSRGAARRQGVGWTPAGGTTPKAATPAPLPATPPPSPPTAAAAPPAASTSDSPRTQFMYGVAGPTIRPDAAPPVAPSAPVAPQPVAQPFRPVRAATPVAPAPTPIAAAPTPVRARAAPPAAARSTAAVSSPAAVRSPAAPAGAITSPVPPDDSARRANEGPRRRARAAARAQTPFEPERADRTLLRAGPIPPPPGEPVVLPTTSSQPLPISPPSGPVRLTQPTPAVEPTVPIPAPVDDDLSHAISVPSGPGNLESPGGTWSFTRPAHGRPLPRDPSAETTLEMPATDAVQPREVSLSSHVKASGTAHVGRYEVLLRLARGGMGTVYLCRVTGEGGFRRLFALKVIRDHLNTNQAYVQMLLEEARIASRLSHPNIVSIIDIDTFAGQHYLVMDYVEGCTLAELLKSHPKSRPPELIVPIMLDGLTGLHAAHSMRGDDGSPHPVVHCDFSPHNMLVGVNGTCRLTDFGVAKAANALQEGPGRGKPGYLSPEQVRGLPLDPRSDVFSAGVVLWNALTGERLFEGDDPQQVLTQVLTRKIPLPSSVGLRPPACFDRVCMKALERDPAKRYQSAEQMLTDLRKVAIAEDLLAPSSNVGRWVQETFGAQIELRRQAAGLAPNVAVAALALRELGSAGPSGHGEGMGHDGSLTGHDLNASMTMMLRHDPNERSGADGEEREGLGPRSRVIVIVAALAFMVAGVVTLFLRPDLLRGGILDENGRYVDLSEPPEPPPLVAGTSGGPTAEVDDTSGAPPPLPSESSGATDTDTDTDAQPSADTEAAPPKGDDKGKKGKKGKDAADPKVPPPTGDPKPKGKGKGKDKGDGGSLAPPPDLDELFRPPGG